MDSPIYVCPRYIGCMRARDSVRSACGDILPSFVCHGPVPGALPERYWITL